MKTFMRKEEILNNAGKYTAVINYSYAYEEGITGINRHTYLAVGNYNTKADLRKVLKANDIKEFHKKPFKGCYSKGAEHQTIEIVKTADYDFRLMEDVQLV